MVRLEEGITDAHLAELYSDPFVARVKDDGMEFAPVVHPLVSYLSAFIDGVFSGAYIVVKFSDFEYEAHAYLMKKAARHSREIGAKLIDWVFGHEQVLRLTGYIREDIRSAVNHCVKMGFKYEGFRRDALSVNGKPMGIHILGLTRKEWCSK